MTTKQLGDSIHSTCSQQGKSDKHEHEAVNAERFQANVSDLWRLSRLNADFDDGTLIL